MKDILRIAMLFVGVVVAWWLVTGLVLPLLGIAIGLAWWLLKVGIAVFLIYWAIQIFKKWNGDVDGGTTTV